MGLAWPPPLPTFTLAGAWLVMAGLSGPGAAGAVLETLLPAGLPALLPVLAPAPVLGLLPAPGPDLGLLLPPLPVLLRGPSNPSNPSRSAPPAPAACARTCGREAALLAGAPAWLMLLRQAVGLKRLHALGWMLGPTAEQGKTHPAAAPLLAATGAWRPPAASPGRSSASNMGLQLLLLLLLLCMVRRLTWLVHACVAWCKEWMCLSGPL